MTEAFGLSDTGCVRANNEDCYRILPELGLYLLADGMGGARAGEKASELAVETMAEVLRETRQRDGQVLLRAVQKANNSVLELARNDPKLEGMGTTLVAALDVGDELLIASVGDSRAYVLDSTSFRAVTEDQSWVNEVGRPLGLDEASLRTHPLRNVLTMAIGAGSQLAVNYYAVPWKPGALALLSSDGLHGVVPREELERILRGEEPLDAKCRRFIEAARKAGAPDNVTAVLLRRAA
ncbi:MAG TPA: protein phosphatase 2C domain-containing protein [Bryobacteraceae bacterium]|jgi:PPM family protein phosphatase|nr:protein phosphatase 2C domain-containing protein [Bryobacteraceae bacterium]